MHALFRITIINIKCSRFRASSHLHQGTYPGWSHGQTSLKLYDDIWMGKVCNVLHLYGFSIWVWVSDTIAVKLSSEFIGQGCLTTRLGQPLHSSSDCDSMYLIGKNSIITGIKYTVCRRMWTFLQIFKDTFIISNHTNLV